MARAALVQAVRAVFAVARTSDPETARRSRLLLLMAAVIELLLIVAGSTVDLVPENATTWLTVVPVGIPAMTATFLLARRARATAAARVLSVFVFGAIVVVAWSEGPSCNRMSVAILAVVAVGAVASARVAALVGLGLVTIIVGLAAAQWAGVYHPVETSASEAPYAPFVRQSLTLGAMMLLLRRGYDWLHDQVRERERACAAAVDAARTINCSLEAQVAERTSTLSAARDRLSGLAAQLTSDLRTSLAAMRRGLHEFAAAEHGLDAAALRPIAKASTAVDRLSLMTTRLHEYASIGTAALRPEPVAMDSLVRDVVDEYSRASRVAIDWRIDPLPPAWVDPALMRTIIENLVGNAIKFSRNRQPPRIHIGHDARGYFVRDNGVGFEARSAGKLFDAFQRLHPDEDFEGYGLGLTNVRRILQRSGGDITAEGEPDRGATFWFWLPGSPGDA